MRDSIASEATRRRLRFDVSLLEDLHSGSGLGWLGQIDDTHARDAVGRPVVWSSTVAGVLRDMADELRELGHSLATGDAGKLRIQRLFGSEGEDARSSLVARSWHFGAVDPDIEAFHVVTSTAREVNSRRPLDQTLRSIEMAASGQKASAVELRFHGDNEDEKLLSLCVKRLSNVGGGKTRGAGLVQISVPTITPLPKITPITRPTGYRRLRVLIRLLEPVCIPATAFPGNVIPCETFLPGPALRGAWLSGLANLGVAESQVDAFATTTVQFTNGYFVNDASLTTQGQATPLQELIAQPLPLTAQSAKATEQRYLEENQTWSMSSPWWASMEDAHSAWLNNLNRERDQFHPALGAGAETSGTKFKRIKTEDVLASADGGKTLYRVRPAQRVLLRNRSPVARLERTWDSRRPAAQSSELTTEQGRKGDLFATTVFSENQHFLAEIQFTTDAEADEFCKSASPFLAGQGQNAEATAEWLRLGRGGRPVVVERWEWVTNLEPKSLQDDAPDFVVTLTSDLIARGDDLTFCSRLDALLLARLARVTGNCNGLVLHDGATETRVVRGFNTAAGTFRSPALAIKRGSAWRVTGSDSTALKTLFEELAKIESKGQGLGERVEEGFGRFSLNDSSHGFVWQKRSWTAATSTTAAVSKPAAVASPPKPTVAGTPQRPSPSSGKKEIKTLSSSPPRRAAEVHQQPTVGHAAPPASSRSPVAQARADRETAIQNVLKLIGDMELADKLNRHEFRQQFPARGQWQNLRHDAETPNRDGQKETASELLNRRDNQNQGGTPWKVAVKGGPLIDQLKKVLKDLPKTAQRRTFLIYFSQWVVVRLDQQRRDSAGTRTAVSQEVSVR